MSEIDPDLVAYGTCEWCGGVRGVVRLEELSGTVHLLLQCKSCGRGDQHPRAAHDTDLTRQHQLGRCDHACCHDHAPQVDVGDSRTDWADPQDCAEARFSD